MKNRGRNHSAQFKAKVALEATNRTCYVKNQSLLPMRSLLTGQYLSFVA